MLFFLEKEGIPATATMWINSEHIILNAMSSSCTYQYDMISLSCGILKNLHINEQAVKRLLSEPGGVKDEQISQR